MKYFALITAILLTTPAFAKSRYKAEPGLYVSDIAQREYNTSTFSIVIEAFNKINAGHLKPGTVIETPRLNGILMKSGFPTKLKATAYQFSQTFDYIQQAQSSLKGQVKQTPRARSRLNRALATLRSVRKNLVNNAKPEAPYMMVAKVDSIIKGVDSFLRKKTVPSKSQFKWLYQEYAKAYVQGIHWGRTRKKLSSEEDIAH